MESVCVERVSAKVDNADVAELVRVEQWKVLTCEWQGEHEDVCEWEVKCQMQLFLPHKGKVERKAFFGGRSWKRLQPFLM